MRHSKALNKSISAALRLGCTLSGYYEQEPPRFGSYLKKSNKLCMKKKLTSPPQHVRRL